MADPDPSLVIAGLIPGDAQDFYFYFYFIQYSLILHEFYQKQIHFNKLA